MSSYLQARSWSGGAAADLHRYADGLATGRRGWGEVARDVAGLVGPDRLTVWTHARYAADPLGVLATLAPVAKLALPPPERDRRRLVSLGARGAAVLEAVETLLTPGERTAMAKLLRRFPFETGAGAISLSDPVLVAALHARYHADLAAIAASGCRFLGDDPAADAAPPAAAGEPCSSAP